MFQKAGIGILLGMALFICFSWVTSDADNGFVHESMRRRASLLECFQRELSTGALGGARLDRLSESLSLAPVISPGIWEAPVFDPDERCWYLTGWISDARAGDWRLFLTLRPARVILPGCSWRFHFHCAGRTENEVPAIELEGCWRSGFDMLRVVYQNVSGSKEALDQFFIHVVRPGHDISRYPAGLFCPEG